MFGGNPPDTPRFETRLANYCLARPQGLEPRTSRSVAGRSIQLSYGRLAEGVGFEPTYQVSPVKRLAGVSLTATRAPLLGF